MLSVQPVISKIFRLTISQKKLDTVIMLHFAKKLQLQLSTVTLVYRATASIKFKLKHHYALYMLTTFASPSLNSQRQGGWKILSGRECLERFNQIDMLLNWPLQENLKVTQVFS